MNLANNVISEKKFIERLSVSETLFYIEEYIIKNKKQK